MRSPAGRRLHPGHPRAEAAAAALPDRRELLLLLLEEARNDSSVPGSASRVLLLPVGEKHWSGSNLRTFPDAAELGSVILGDRREG
ncbi:hypothetical protein KIL84_016658 [Mauremys mutica]|uniref:Uncharacterized protein n=1 Tax=Mauremys mutica TaxID=74926 RepID=A0A9D3X2Y2_9SAUR|nr:hypothetical protein KIL84_016658 [Mauremys mutica]